MRALAFAQTLGLTHRDIKPGNILHMEGTEIKIADFGAAIAFIGRAAGPIDEMDHHPEWTNVYNRVDIRLSSHDVGGVTDRDVQLARVLERLAAAS